MGQQSVCCASPMLSCTQASGSSVCDVTGKLSPCTCSACKMPSPPAAVIGIKYSVKQMGSSNLAASILHDCGGNVHHLLHGW